MFWLNMSLSNNDAEDEEEDGIRSDDKSAEEVADNTDEAED